MAGGYRDQDDEDKPAIPVSDAEGDAVSSTNEVLIGMRVVRGPDWTWLDQDGGEGCCGTIVEVGRPESITSPCKTAVVQWDCGPRTNYRCGYNDAYDLRCVDSGPAGVYDSVVACDGCGKRGVAGIAWKCVTCPDYDLCTPCYNNDKHDLTHPFLRLDFPSAPAVRVPPRISSYKLCLKGIFLGSKVVRGADWDWGNQDGSPGGTGRVVDIRGWDNESSRSVVNVTWVHSGTTNIYRLGHKGKVDLKCVEPAIWGHVYRDHLPIVGLQPSPSITNDPVANPPESFHVGDDVKVNVDVETLTTLQLGHGGWNPLMAQYVDRIGRVHRVTDKGNIRVQYEGKIRWTFNPKALAKVFAVGRIVTISSDLELVKELQKGHGEWTDAMTSALGKNGRVTKVYKDGDLRVEVEGKTWTVNKLVVKLVGGDSKTDKNGVEDTSEKLEKCQLTSVPEVPAASHAAGIEKAVNGAMHGRTEYAIEFFSKHPNLVNAFYRGKTCLQVASHQGYIPLIKFLLSISARLDIPDADGDSALHFAAYGNQDRAIQLLIAAGADVNAVNPSGCTPLHVAVNKQHAACVQSLLRHPRCDANRQDSFGDTPLHDAVGKDSTEIIDMLIAHTGVDLSVKNQRGFNALHHAALKGNNMGVERIVAAARCLVDCRKDDGFAALHLAALNGHRVVAETLLTQGRADVNLRNKKGQTSLHLAVSQSHVGCIELLVRMRADISTQDDDGMTAVHTALALVAKPQPAASSAAAAASSTNSVHSVLSLAFGDAPEINSIYQEIRSQMLEHSVPVAIAHYLVSKGGVGLLDVPAKCGRTPLQLLRSSSISNDDNEDEDGGGSAVSDLYLHIRQLLTQANVPSSSAALECIVCSDTFESVAGLLTFEPCGHTIACEVCGARMRKCLRCSAVIARRVAPDGRIIHPQHAQASCVADADAGSASGTGDGDDITKKVEDNTPGPNDRLRYLESKIQEFEEQHVCSICMERKRNVAFLCGHGACMMCATPLTMCHMCRKTIVQKINLY